MSRDATEARLPGKFRSRVGPEAAELAGEHTQTAQGSLVW